MTNPLVHPDAVHRLVKSALDAGVAQSLEEAQAIFTGYRLVFVLDDAVAKSRVHQIALLSGVALASRVLLGGVEVVGALDGPLLVPIAQAATLSDAVRQLGGTITAGATAGIPLVFIGGPARARRSTFGIRTMLRGWSGGIAPTDHEVDETAERDAMPLTGLLAAALAVNEVFIHLRQESALAGRRKVGLSLWRPDEPDACLALAEGAPALAFLPSRLWLLGLGHLGQAFLWALGLLPYPNPSGVELVLQDVDVVTPSTTSTSILSTPDHIGRRKTRVVADWCEARGFSTLLHERFFDESFRRQSTEPTAALCGFDNPSARRVLDSAGFGYVIEAGLGAGHKDFRAIRMHTLPGPRTANELWPTTLSVEPQASLPHGYKKLLEAGVLDQCGATLLAGKSVGAPFVGAVTACLVVSELLRKLHSGPEYEVADLDLMDLNFRSFVPRSTPSGTTNPGFVLAAATP